jgi:glycosyltransferase involved in cell wall biosynthesis
MQILMSTHNCAYAGGAFWRAYPLACGLARRGHMVTLLAGRRPGVTVRVPDPPPGVRVLEAGDRLPFRLRHSGLNPVDLFARLMFASRNRNWDIVHAVGIRPAAVLPGLVLRRRHGIPLVVDWDDLWGGPGIASERGLLGRHIIGFLDGLWERHMVRTADQVIAICGDLAERAGEFGVSPNRIHVLPGGANLDGLPRLPRDEARRRHGIPIDRNVVFHCGYSPYDRVLLDATVREIARRRPDVFFLFAGEEPRLLSRDGFLAGKQARYAGNVPYDILGELFACADLVLLPFSDKPVNRCRFPNRLGDCMAAGRPVLTNNTADVGQIVAEAGIGLAAASSATAMADAADRLLQEPDMCKQMGRRARQTAEERFDWNRLAGRLEQIYLDARTSRASSDCHDK